MFARIALYVFVGCETDMPVKCGHNTTAWEVFSDNILKLIHLLFPSKDGR